MTITIFKRQSKRIKHTKLQQENYMSNSHESNKPVGEVKNLFTQAAWEKLDVRGSTKVYLGTPPASQPAVPDAITAIKQAFDKKAENARELGLDYEPVQEPVACVQDLDEVKRKHLVYENGMDWKDPLYTTPPAAPVQEPTLQEQLDDAMSSRDFYKRRIDALQQWQSKMRDPERTIVCDIIANGCTLEPAGDRYPTPPAAPAQEPVQRWAVFCGGCRKEWHVPYQHPGKSICAECEAKCATPPAQPAPVQEPVMEYPDYTPGVGWRNVTPPAAQRQWTGLTDEDVYLLANEHLHYQTEGYEVSGVYNLARAIEAKLKENT